MKKTTLHRHTHPIHWHGSMLVAVAAILLTSVKCSSEMMRALHAVPTPSPVMDSVIMRDAEQGIRPLFSIWASATPRLVASRSVDKHAKARRGRSSVVQQYADKTIHVVSVGA